MGILECGFGWLPFWAKRMDEQADSVDNILKWSSLKPDTQRKLLWDNAARFYKQT